MIRDNDGSTRLGISYFYPTGIGGQPSGVRTIPLGQQDPLTDSADGAPGTPAPYAILDPAQSGVGGSVPWHSEPGDIPRPHSTPVSQVCDDTVAIGVQTPWTGTVTPATAPPAEAEPLKPTPQPPSPSGTGRDDPTQFAGPVSCIDIHDPRESNAPTVSEPSNVDIGELARKPKPRPEPPPRRKKGRPDGH
jgi:hypothetical protein